MRSSAPVILALSGFSLTGLQGESSTKPRPAWTSTLQCLAPFAQQARDGSAPLTSDQAFFDGPFSLPDHADDYTQTGFAYLFAFDDREAERNFRLSIYKNPIDPFPWIGLAFANRSSERRSAYFLTEARNRLENSSPECRALLERLPKSLSGDSTTVLEDLRILSRQFDNPIFSGLFHRESIFEKLRQTPDSHTAGLKPEPSPFPLPHEMPIPVLLSAAAGDAQSVAPVVQSMEADLDRLDRIGSVMPGDSINFGSSAALLLRRLSLEGRHEQVKALATQFLHYPRDPFSVGTRWRNLTRDNALWPAARRELAANYIARKKWESLAELPRGFDDRDKAEWFAWQVVAANETEGNFNPWLAALRGIRGTADIVSKLETYLAEENLDGHLPPGIPGVIPALHDTGVQSSASHPDLPDFRPPVRQANSFSLPDWENKPITLADYEDHPVIVIFFLGGGCLHCVEQLTAFGPWAEKFRAAGVEIVSISTDPVEVLTHTLADDEERTKSFPIPIASDSEHIVFRDWGVFDEFDDRPLHGTFLIDPEGNIIWEEKGNTPYMHPDFLLHEARRLLAR